MKFSIICLIAISVSSCSAILSKFYGVKYISEVDIEGVGKFYDNINMQDFNIGLIFIDSAKFEEYRRLGVEDEIIKDLSQPTQAIYFINDSLVSFHANCYAKGGFKNLNWNFQNRFDYFTPLTAAELNNNYPKFNKVNELFGLTDDDSEIKVIILWTMMFESISKSLIETVLLNAREYHKEKEIKLFIINNDDFYSKLY